MPLPGWTPSDEKTLARIRVLRLLEEGGKARGDGLNAVQAIDKLASLCKELGIKASLAEVLGDLSDALKKWPDLVKSNLDELRLDRSGGTRMMVDLRELMYARGLNGCGLSSEECMDIYLEMVFDEQRRAEANREDE
jgi:hypothetical protein